MSGSYHFPAGKLSQAVLILSVKPAVPPMLLVFLLTISLIIPVIASKLNASLCPGKKDATPPNVSLCPYMSAIGSLMSEKIPIIIP